MRGLHLKPLILILIRLKPSTSLPAREVIGPFPIKIKFLPFDFSIFLPINSPRSARMPRSEERGGMAARSEAEAHSLLVYKSPAWKGGVLYSGKVACPLFLFPAPHACGAGVDDDVLD